MIISVGYRVKSQNGILFRKWATSVLKDYMLKGYAVNQKRLEYLEKTIKLIDIANRIDERLEENDAKEILKVIGEYSKALDLYWKYLSKFCMDRISTKVQKKKEQSNQMKLEKIYKKNTRKFYKRKTKSRNFVYNNANMIVQPNELIIAIKENNI